MLDLRAFMFERVYLGPAAGSERARASATVPASSAASPTIRTRSPPTAPATRPQRVTDYVAGMTDRFALAWP